MIDDLLQQLQSIRDERALKHKKRYRRSRLDRYRAEFLYLQEAGASHEDIRLWLSKYQHVKMHSTTISRALKRWHQREG